jgi:hypothetical protein
VTSEDDWTPSFEAGLSGERFKWAYNGQTREVVVWEVGGPGDGLPTHRDHLLEYWHREVHPGDGDVLGSARQDDATLTLVAYYGARVPDEVVEQFRTRLPNSTIKLSS